MWVVDDQQYLGQLDGWNRAAQFADGLFETMVIKQGLIQGLDYHVRRMAMGCERLDIKQPNNDLAELFVAHAHKLVELSDLKSGVLKIIISRGESQRGYAYDDSIRPRVTAFYNRLPQYENGIYEHGVLVKTLNTRCSIQSQLAGIKHLNRLENVLAKKELASQAFEGLMCNHLGFVIEGTASNVFFEKENSLLTPQLNLSGVAGVVREGVLTHAHVQKINIDVVDITTQQLDQFEHGFICNSVMGIVPISSLDGRPFKIGPITKIIQDAWNNGVIYA